MMTPKLLVLVRHGESVANVAKLGDVYVTEGNAALIKGISDHDISLTALGRHQAVMTGPLVREKYGVFDAVYDSGYVRAEQTRISLLKAYSTDELAKMEIRQSWLVRERERGYTFDMTQPEALKHFPWLPDYYKINGHFYTRPPGGQNHADMCLQIDCFLRKLFDEWAGKKVMIVTHGHTIRAFRFLLEGWTPEYYHELMCRGGCVIDNCGVTEYAYDCEAKNLVLKNFNQIFCHDVGKVLAAR